MFLKYSGYPETLYLNTFLLLTATSLKNLSHSTTKNRCRIRYILNTKTFHHLSAVAAYLYSELTKRLLTLLNMNYLRKNPIYLK